MHAQHTIPRPSGNAGATGMLFLGAFVMGGSELLIVGVLDLTEPCRGYRGQNLEMGQVEHKSRISMCYLQNLHSTSCRVCFMLTLDGGWPRGDAGRYEEERSMTRRTGRVVCGITISADGYSAGLNQTEQRPFGDDGGDGWGDKLHAWFADTPEENRAEIDKMTDAQAFIMGRNMFGPVRGEWDRQWNGWWGDDPPYHGPVFVLTHQPREPQPMDGGTTFHFVTDGIESALAQARAAAGDGDVAIMGGATTINQYLAASLIDELRLHIVPLTLGAGTRLFDGVPPLKLEQVQSRAARLVTHVTYRVLS